MAETTTPAAFNPASGMNAWIRIVNKRQKMLSVINTSKNLDDLDKEQQKLLSDIFLTEVGSYGPMMFNIAENKTKNYWNVRNNLSPILNSILFTPFIKLETYPYNGEQESETITNEPDQIIAGYLRDNKNLNYTQIENIQKILNKINDENYEINSNLDLNNQIRILKYNVEWINEGYITREAKLSLYLEHEQLIKTKMMHYLLTLNNRVKITTGFYNLFQNEKDFDNFISQFNQNQIQYSNNGDDTFIGYKEMVEESEKESENDEWSIYNFSISYNDDGSAIVELSLVQLGYEKKEKIENISPIQLLSEEVLTYLTDKKIIQSSTQISSEHQKNNNKVFVPANVISNEKNKSDKSQGANRKENSFLVIDAANFMLHLFKLWAFHFRQIHNNVNKQFKINRNFMITFEVDLSAPKQDSDNNERFDGCLLNYISLDLNEAGPSDWKSFSLFDYDQLKNKWIEDDKYTDFCFSYDTNQSFLWNSDITQKEPELQKTETQTDNNSWIWRDILAYFPQANFISKNTYQQTMYYSKDGEITSIDTSMGPVAPGKVTTFEQRDKWTEEQLRNMTNEQLFSTNYPYYSQDTRLITRQLNSTVNNALKDLQKYKKELKELTETVDNFYNILNQIINMPDADREALKIEEEAIIIYNLQIAKKKVDFIGVLGLDNDFDDIFPKPIQFLNSKFRRSDANHFPEVIKLHSVNDAGESTNPNYVSIRNFEDINHVISWYRDNKDRLDQLYKENKQHRKYIRKQKEIDRSNKRIEDAKNQLIESILKNNEQINVEVEIGENKLESITNYYSYYNYPIYKVSTHSDAWLEELSKPMGSFIKEMIQDVYKSRLNAVKNTSAEFAVVKNRDITKNDNDPTFRNNSNSAEEDLCWYTWDTNRSPKSIRKYSQEKGKGKDDEGKDISYPSEAENWATVIDPQLDSFKDLSIISVVHDADFKNKVEPAFKTVIDTMLNDESDYPGWIEFIVSDTNNNMLLEEEFETFTEIQSKVFNQLDSNVMEINKYFDNNLISLKSSSETLSDMPFMLGEFSLPKKKQDDFEQKLKKIREKLSALGQMHPSDRSRLENKIALIKRMADAEHNENANIKTIAGFINNQNDKPTEDMYNSISGSDFLSSFSDIGIEMKLKRSLFDSLLYKANGSNFYVPNVKLFTPFFLYSSKEYAIKAQEHIYNNYGELSKEDLKNIYSKVAPQTGLYKIMKLNSSIDEYGNWTQNWEGIKLDYGFSNEIYKILSENNDESESRMIDAFGVDELMFNFSDANFVFPLSYYSSDKKNFKKWFDQISIFTGTGVYNITDNLEKSLINDIDNNWFNPYLYQNCWPINNVNHDFQNYYSQKNINKSNDFYWYSKVPIRNYNTSSYFFPYYLAFSLIKSYGNFDKNSLFKNLSDFIYFLNDGDKDKKIKTAKAENDNKFIHPIESFIALEKKFDNKSPSFNKIYENEAALKTALDDKKVDLNEGAVITIQRLDHPSISRDLLFSENSTITFQNNILKTNDLALFDTINGKQNYAWRTLEKYVILNNQNNSKDFYFNFEDDLTKQIESISSWKEYQTINKGLLEKYKLNYRPDFSDLSMKEYISKMFIQSIKNILGNFYTEIHYKDVINVVEQSNSDNKWSVKFNDNGAERSSSGHQYFINNFKNKGKEWDDYKKWINEIMSKYNTVFTNLEVLFKEHVIDKINHDISSSTSFTNMVSEKGDDEDAYVKNIVKNKSKQYNKMFYVKSLQYIPDFLEIWQDGDCDFDLVSSNENSTQGYSAIRWNYLKDSLPEFVWNINLNEILNMNQRNEKYFVEKLGYRQKTFETNKSYEYNKWFKNKQELDNHNKSPIWFDDVNYEFNNEAYNFSATSNEKNDKEQSIEDYQKKYGQIRVIINDKFTSNNLFGTEDKCINFDRWLYQDLSQKEIEKTTFVGSARIGGLLKNEKFSLAKLLYRTDIKQYL